MISNITATLVARALVLGAFLFTAGLTARADTPPGSKPTMDDLAAMASSLQWQTGTITLKDGLAKIQLTPDFRFLDAANAQKVLHDIWGNPPDADVLGMIFPANKGPIDPDPWGIMIKYDDGGYVKDDDAATINYDDLLKQMQNTVAQASPERVKEGYPSIQLIGWATPPHYDKTSHKLYWAKEFKFGDDTQDTLNYDIRILGRHGALVLSAISPMDDLPEIDQKVPAILSMVDFQPGNAYADFDPRIDKVAEYGLAGLIAGGALAGAAKLGLFGALIKILIAGWKLVLVAVAAVVASAKKFFGRMTSGSNRTVNYTLPTAHPPQEPFQPPPRRDQNPPQG